MDHKQIQNPKSKIQNWEALFIKLTPIVFAQTPHDLGPIGGERNTGLGPWSWLFQEEEISSAAEVFAGIISRIIGVMTIIAGIWFIFQFISGGYNYMAAGGDQQKMTNATKRITNSLIGLVVVVAAYAVMSLLGAILGFNFLNIGGIINLLKP